MTASAQASLALALALVGILAVDTTVTVALAQESTGHKDGKVTFTWASTGEPSSLNPMTGYSATDFYFWTASYHPLVDCDQDFGVEPFGGPDAGLATDIRVSDDRMEFTYAIRDDVVWSDGTPLTAEEVAHAYRPQYGSPTTLVARYREDATLRDRVHADTSNVSAFVSMARHAAVRRCPRPTGRRPRARPGQTRQSPRRVLTNQGSTVPTWHIAPACADGGLLGDWQPSWSEGVGSSGSLAAARAEMARST